MTREETIKALTILKDQALKSHNDTAVIDVKKDSFVFVIQSAIEIIEEMTGQHKSLSEEERLEGMAWMEHETNRRAVNAICNEFSRDFAEILTEQGLYEEGLTLMKSLEGESE